MNRGQSLVLVGFAGLVGLLGALVLPSLLGPRPAGPRRSSTLPVPVEPSTSSRTTPRATPGPAPAPPAATRLAEPFPLEVVGPDGKAVPPSRRRFVGARGTEDLVVFEEAQAWVGAAGLTWAPLSPPGADGVARVSLGAARAILVVLLEQDGSPAADVPLAWAGPDGALREARTDARGLVTVDDRAAGLVFAKAGGVERAGPVLRLRAGQETPSRATLEPAWVLTGRVLDPEGAPVAGAVLRGAWPEGEARRGPWNARTAADGTYRWSGRASDRLSLVVEHPRFRPTRVEPLLPDPRGPLRSELDVRLRPAAAPLAFELDRTALAPSARLTLRAEPAVLALVREAYGPASVRWSPSRTVTEGAGGFVEDDAEGTPLRLELRGDLVPEDHILASGGAARTRLRLAPRRAPPDPPPAPLDPALASARLEGSITDADGAPLRGLTVMGGGRRATTNAEGAFALEGLVPNDRVEVLWTWLDGAEPGPIDAAVFPPFASARMAPSTTPVRLRLPFAAGVTFLLQDGLDKTKVSWARVVVLDGEGEVRFDDVVAPHEGRVTLAGLFPGSPGTLHVATRGLRREVSLALRAGSIVELGEVPLVRGGRIEGIVRDPDGRPVSGAEVAALDDGRDEGVGRAYARERELHLRRTRTDEQGGFVLEGLDATRPLPLAVWAPGHPPALRRILWSEDGRAQSTITFARPGRVVLVLADPEGAPVSGALVDFREARTGARVLDLWHGAAWGGVVGSTEDLARAAAAFLVEDPKQPGRYALGPLEPGPYDVTIAHPGYLPFRARYAVVDPSTDSPDNPMRIPLEGLQWRVRLEPAPAEAR